MAERIDDLQYKGLTLLQDTEAFCFGTDAVLLAAFTDVYAGDTIVDFGTGNGILPVLLSARHDRVRLVGIEINKEAAGLARRNLERNGITNRARIIDGDLREAAGLVQESVTAVVCNPPYEKVGTGGVSEREAIRIARHEVLCTLAEAVKSAARLLQTRGRFYIIHRAGRTAEVLYEMKTQGLEPKALRFVQARTGENPGYVLIKGVKDAAPHVQVLPPLILLEADGSETEEVRQIYHRDGRL